MQTFQYQQGPNTLETKKEEKYSIELPLDDEKYIVTIIKKKNSSQITLKCENKFDFLSYYKYSITLTYDEFTKIGKSFRLFDNIDEIFNIIKNLFIGVDFSLKKQNSNTFSNQMQINNGFIQMSNNSFQIQFKPDNQYENIVETINVQCNPDDNISSIIEKYRNKSGDYDQNKKFIFNGDVLSPNLTVTQAGITDFDNTIFVSIDTQISSNIKIEHSMNNSINLVLTIPLLNVKQETIKIEFKKENIDIKSQYKKLKQKYLNIMKIVFPDGNYDNKNSIMKNHINKYSNLNNFNQIISSDEILEKIKKELLGNNQMVGQNIMGNNMGNDPMMQQQQQMMQAQMQHTTDSSSAQSQGYDFSVIFRTSGANEQASAPIEVQCMPNDKVADIIEKYRNKAGDRDDTKKFIFNAKDLARYYSSLTLAEAGITHNANIFVVATKGIKGY